MRLIDADNIHYALIGQEVDGKDCYPLKDMLDGLHDEEVNPTIDPVHAAGGCYCRECENWLEPTESSPIGSCLGPHWGRVGKDDFCSQGERKKQND